MLHIYSLFYFSKLISTVPGNILLSGEWDWSIFRTSWLILQQNYLQHRSRQWWHSSCDYQSAPEISKASLSSLSIFFGHITIHLWPKCYRWTERWRTSPDICRRGESGIVQMTRAAHTNSRNWKWWSKLIIISRDIYLTLLVKFSRSICRSGERGRVFWE